MVTTTYLWDPISDNVLSEDADGMTTAFTQEPSLYGNLVSQRIGLATHSYHFDARGDTRELTNDTGMVTDTSSYNSYGSTIAATGQGTSPLQFIGRVGYYDDSTLHSHYVRARWYDSLSGRWASPDPLGVNVGPNAYQYGMSNPVSQVDPSGQLCAESICGPDITKQLDATLSKAISVFYRNSVWTRIWACQATSFVEWDITTLHQERVISGTCPSPPKSVPPINCCYQCVEVNGHKHDMHEVNYALWGLLFNLCGRTFTGAQTVADLWKLKYLSNIVFGDICHPAAQLTISLIQWIRVGYTYPELHLKAIDRHAPKTDDARFDECSLCDNDNPLNQLPNKPFNFNLFYGLGGFHDGIG